ncbi:MAG: TolC family protein [Actinobacteria bacterium]|nr:TolC family protein [Actinomycetota bacterium]
MKRWKRAVGFLMVSLVLGLSVVPGFRARAEVNPPKTLALSLDQAKELALKQNPSVELADLKVKRAEIAADKMRRAASGVSQAESALDRWPAGVPLPATLSGIDTYDTQTVKVLKDQAALAVTWAEKGARLAREGLKMAVEKAYYDVIKAGENLKAAQDGLARARQLKAQAEQAVNAGTAAKNDLLAAGVQVASAQSALSMAQKGQEIALMTLNKTLGNNLKAPLKLTTGLIYEPVGPVDVDARIAQALDKRLEMAQARGNLEIKRLTLELAEKYYTPNVDVYKTDELDVREAEIALDQKTQDVRLEVQQAYVTLTGAEERVGVAAKGLDLARESFRLANVRYQAGVTTSYEVTAAQAALSQAEAQAIQALYDYNLAKGIFRNATAEGLD